MATKFITNDRQTPLLLPPDLRDWVKKDYLVHFIIDADEHIDVSSVAVNQRGSGSAQYPPSMLLALLVYSYATGVFSGRQIERATDENMAVRLLCADTHPDHDTIYTFRRENRELVQKAFAQLLEMSAACGVLKLGQITVASDGTIILANASKHSSVSYEHAVKTIEALDLEIVDLLRKAEAADSAPLQGGLTIPAEIQRREERKAIVAQTKAEIEARAHLRFRAEQANYEAIVEKCAAFTEATGKKSSGREPTKPDPAPGPNDQINLSDEVSRIMKTGQGFQQCYNAQAGADTDSRLIVGPRVTNAPTDKQQLGPNWAAIAEHVPVKNVVIDSGFVSEAAMIKAESSFDGSESGIVVYAAIKREGHGRTIAQLEAHEDPPHPGPETNFSKRMLHRTATAAGRALHKLGHQTLEPIFGIIKETLGFRRFLLCGLLAGLLPCTAQAEAPAVLLQDTFSDNSLSLTGTAGTATLSSKTGALRTESGAGVLTSTETYATAVLALNLADHVWHENLGFSVQFDLQIEAEDAQSVVYLHLGYGGTSELVSGKMPLDFLSPTTPLPLTVVINPGQQRAELRSNRVLLAQGTFMRPQGASGTPMHVSLKLRSGGMGLGVPAFADLQINGKTVADGHFYWYLNPERVQVGRPSVSPVWGVTGKSSCRLSHLSFSLLEPEERVLPAASLGRLKPFWKYQPVVGPYLTRGQAIETYDSWDFYPKSDVHYLRQPGQAGEVLFARGINVVRLLGSDPSETSAPPAKAAAVDLELAYRDAHGQISYRWDNLRAKLAPYQAARDYDYTFVLDNVPHCFVKDPVSGPYGQVGGPDNLAEWGAFVTALAREIGVIFGQEKANSFRFRLLTEARLYVKNIEPVDGKEFKSAPKADYLRLYETTAHALKAALPGAKFGPYNQAGGSFSSFFFRENTAVVYPDVARYAVEKNLPLDFLCASKYYTAATDPDEFAFSFINCYRNLQVEFPQLARTPLELHEWELNDFEAKRQQTGLQSKETGAFGTSLIAHMMVRLGEQGLERLYHWGLLDPIRLQGKLKGFLTGQGYLYHLMEPMIGGQAWVYRPQQPISPHGTKHLCLGSFKAESAYLLLTAHNPKMERQAEETVSYHVPKERFPQGIKRVRYTRLNRQTDPYAAMKSDLLEAGLLKPEYAKEPLRISTIRDMAQGKEGEALIAAHWAKYVGLCNANLTLKPCPWPLVERGDDYEITLKLSPPEVALVVID